MSLEINKIAAAVLITGVIAMVVSKASELAYSGAEHGDHGEAKRGYTIAGAESAGEAAEGASATPAAPVDIMPLLAAADAAKGETLTKACVTCHTFEKGGPNKVGPNLAGVVGGPKAHKGDFAYSEVLKSKGGSWDPQSLSEFLEKPAKYLPGTKMSFAGVKKPEDRAAVIKYLQSK